MQNTGWLLTGKGVGAVLSLFYLAIVTRTLGPTGFGLFSLILSAAQTIGIIISFETWQIIVRYGQDYIPSGDHEKFGRLFFFCIALDLCGAFVGSLIAMAGAFLLGPELGLTKDMAVQAALFSMVMLLTIRSTPTGILRLFDRFDAGAFAETMVPVGRMIGALAVWLTGPSVSGFLMAWAGAELLCAVAYWYLALKTIREKTGRLSGRRFLTARHDQPEILRYLVATNISTSVSGATRQVAVLLVGGFVGPASAGLYRLANQLSASLTKIAGLLSKSIFAELAKVRANADAESLRALFSRASLLAIITGILIAIIVVFIGKPLLLLLAGPEYAAAYPLLVLLGIAAAIDLIGVTYEPLLMATGRMDWSVKIRLFNAVLLVLLLTILLPRFGTIGAAIATLAVAVVGLLLMGRAAKRAALQAG